jgi:peptide/nickel transport system permease protein
MIAAGQEKVKDHPHMVFVPGIVMFVTVYSINRIGDAARQRWDPREASL